MALLDTGPHAHPHGFEAVLAVVAVLVVAVLVLAAWAVVRRGR